MKLLNHLSIRARLGLGFGALLLAAAAMVGFTAAELARVRGEVQAIVDEDWVKAADAATIEATTRDNARNTMELFFADEAGARAIRQRIADNRGRIDTALARLERLVRRPQGKTMLAALASTRRDYVASFSRVDALLREGDADGARRLLTTQTLPTLDALQRHVGELSALQTRLAREAGAQALAQVELARRVLLATGLAMLGLGLLATWAIGRSIVRPICRAVRVAEAVAAGRLGQRLDADEGGETGRLMRALDAMNQSLARLVEGVRGASEGIATGSHQIAGGTADLSQRTEEQAANLQQTAASMEELAGAVRQNAASAHQASSLAQGASAAAEEGGEMMSEVSGTMNDIGEASRRIEEISAVIDGIAFQTNLLALNAAVEAARAGEHGRGFAVVAGEVRALSRRSGDAAREIRSLIQHSSERVARGGDSVERAQRQIDQIVARVREVSTTLAHISDAAGEQTRGIEQVNLAVAQLDQVTQQNAALVEQSAAASDSLDEQARRLLQAVGVFALEPAAA